MDACSHSLCTIQKSPRPSHTLARCGEKTRLNALNPWGLSVKIANSNLAGYGHGAFRITTHNICFDLRICRDLGGSKLVSYGRNRDEAPYFLLLQDDGRDILFSSAVAFRFRSRTLSDLLLNPLRLLALHIEFSF
jgi:hypothetical protein